MSTPKFILSLAVVLAAAGPADAHRVDEYLQATLVSIGLEHIDLEINLTTGIEKASEVFGWIDTNRDGEISETEGEAYAHEVLRAVVLKVDGWAAPIRLEGADFPQFREMSLGVGTIRLRASAKFPAVGGGPHQVSFLNAHQPAASVYLVNALVPSDSRIRLGEQRRDVAQHGLTLDYSVAADAPVGRAFVVIAGFGMLVWLLWRLASTLAAKLAKPLLWRKRNMVTARNRDYQ